MIRAVVKDRRGDIVKGPLHFADKQEMEAFVKSRGDQYSRAGWHLDEIAVSPLNVEQLEQLEDLDLVCRQANKIMKHFHFDGDMVRRWRNRTPTLNDVRCLRDAIVSAGDQFLDLAVKEFGIKL